jgi:DNA-binding PadR family transcriptional regulator
MAKPKSILKNLANKTPAPTEEKQDLRKLSPGQRPAPTTGQSGPKLSLGWTDLNADEQKIVRALGKVHDDAEAGTATRAPIGAIVKAAGRDFSSLRVRNGMRRLVRASWVKGVGRGVYALTAAGIKRFAEAQQTTPQTAKKLATSKPVKAAKPAKAAKVVVKSAKTSKTKEQSVSLDRLHEEIRNEAPSIEQASEDYKAALVVKAAQFVGLSDTKIAKVTGLSRGFVIPRVKRLKAATDLSGGLAFKVNIAQGALPTSGNETQPAASAQQN